MSLPSSTSMPAGRPAGAIIAMASRRDSSKGSRSPGSSGGLGRSIGPSGLLVLFLLVLLYFADDRFEWGLFPRETPTATTVTAPFASSTRVASSGAPSGLPADAVAAEVVSVADGDTVRVRIAGEEYSVRLIGVDTPETYTTRTGYAECWGEEASNFTKSILVPGTTVYLERDQSDTDQYGRLVRFLWVDAGEVGLGEPGEAIMFNEVLVRAGYAIPYAYRPDTSEAERFAAAAEQAEAEGIGIWCACGGERIPEDQTKQGCPIPEVPAA